MFFHVFMFYVGLLIAWLCFIRDILLFIDLFSCIAASLFNKLTCFLGVVYNTAVRSNEFLSACVQAYQGHRSVFLSC